MHVATVTYSSLSISWDATGTMTIARTDAPQSIQITVSEWVLLMKIAELRGWPVAAPGVVSALQRGASDDV
jgi:hypothetical protein